MQKKALVVIIILVVAAVLYYYFSTRGSGCPPARNPDKFKAWNDSDVGQAHQVAREYANPILGEDTHKNAAIVAGFFKGIDVRVDMQAAKYYKSYLVNYLKSEHTYPHWSMAKGELLC